MSDRRTLITDATARIAATGGLEMVSFRRVAAEAGVSSTLVQHYFPAKEDLLGHTLREVNAAAEAAGRERLAGAGEEPDADLAAVLQRLLEEFLPLDPGRDLAIRVHLAFFARAAQDPSIAALYIDTTRAMVELIAGLLRDVRSSTGASAHGSMKDADAAVSLATALGTEIAAGTRSVDSARDLLAHQVRRILSVD